MASTFRSDVRDGYYALALAFAAANTSYNLTVKRVRPNAFGDRPLVFVGTMNEAINNTQLQNIWQRNMTPTLVFVWASSSDQGELADVRDDLIDAFLSYAQADPHAASDRTVSEPTGVEDVELELDGAFYPASVVSFAALSAEGRL